MEVSTPRLRGSQDNEHYVPIVRTFKFQDKLADSGSVPSTPAFFSQRSMPLPGFGSLHSCGSVDVEEFRSAQQFSSPSSPGAQHAAEGAEAKQGGAAWLLAALPGLAYCSASIGMVLFNKVALSSHGFSHPTVLLLFQFAMCVVLVLGLRLARLGEVEPLTWRLARAWLPVNLLYVGMTWTSFAALARLSVPTVTVLKNLTNLVVICGDRVFYGKTHSWGMWGSLMLIALSALAGGAFDLQFDAAGYAWQLLNCIFAAAYSLVCRGVMDSVAAARERGRSRDTDNGGSLPGDQGRLSELSMVYLNNLLSLPLGVMLAAATGELQGVAADPALRRPAFAAAALASALLAFCISFTALWFLSTTSATVYSLVGSLNKIPLALTSILLFRLPVDARSMTSIMIGLAAGVLFTQTL
ncbi:hypothetical protein WJX81_006272 [Elliptochloris bilobata]|uniref:Sugar phosphate transporter domain-containing protein n=1 Tax=Elliptochloris bilobata TaxID=381761 RepID=A0AAW1RCE1_9CHLO